MVKGIVNLLLLGVLIGCGSDDTTQNDREPQSIHQQEATQAHTNESPKPEAVHQPAPTAKPKQQAKKKSVTKKISRTLYISIGDSTRAAYGQYVYKIVSAKLHQLGIHTKLMATSGYRLSSFTYDEGYPSVSGVIDSISGNGSTTIVNIALGINDYHDDEEEIASHLKTAVQKILSAKPKTRVVLTTPNRLLHARDHTRDINRAYERVAGSLGLTLIHAGQSLGSDYFYGDGVHPNHRGQEIVASEVLNGITSLFYEAVDESEVVDDEDWRQWDD